MLETQCYEKWQEMQETLVWESWPRLGKGQIELLPLLEQEHTIWKIWMEDHFPGHGMFTI